MNIKRLVITAVFVYALSLLAVAAFARAPMPAGSFLKQRAASVGDLVGQVRSDPAVARRFSLHFQVSPDELTDYMTRELSLVSLSKPLRTRVWFVSTHGKIVSKVRLLPKGTLVFQSRDGKPMFLWACGNPLADRVPKVKVAPEPPEEVLAPPVPAEVGSTDVVAQAVPRAPELDLTALPPVPAAPAFEEHRSVGLAWLPQVGAGVGGLVGLVVTRTDSPRPTIPEVPAPVLAALGLPLGLLGARLRRR